MKLIYFLAQVLPPPENLPQTPVTHNTVTNAISIILGVAGAIAFIIVIIGGLQYIISRGEPQATAKAKDTIMYALIGLVISVMAFTIVRFVIGKL